ncbi:MAG TPA: type II toxin-antitoxin system Phd/YefM family antitoxin [Spirochaetes bacterium]|nr:type II toxin-antitoxin system Phd/YefM family antitoxin [Spirochaetota bacterium]
MKLITANELKTRGVSSIDQALQDGEEALISVWGHDRYVVMDIDAYNRLRVCELDAAIYQCQKEIAAGEGIEESPEEHLARVKNLDQ